MGIKERLKRLEGYANPEGRTQITCCVYPPRCPEYAEERKAIAKKLRADRAAGVEIVTVRVVPPKDHKPYNATHTHAQK